MDNHAEFLVIIDMQNDFVSGSLGSEDAKAIVPKVAAFLGKFLEEHGKQGVIFTKDTHEKNYAETNEGRHLPVPHCIIGTPGWDIAPELGQLIFSYTKRHPEDRADAMVVEKPTFGSVDLPEILIGKGAALYTGADSRLDGAGVVIHLMGLCTDICVISNAVLAKTACPEVPVCIDARCTASPDDTLNEATLDVLASLQVQVINR